MELNMKILQVSLAIGVAMCAVKYMQVLKDMQFHLQSSWKRMEKLTFLEKRMENLTQSGMETARHMAQLVHESDVKLSKGSVRLALRIRFWLYSTWRAARVLPKQWVEDEVQKSRMTWSPCR